jgi:hypothetical protein
LKNEEDICLEEVPVCCSETEVFPLLRVKQLKKKEDVLLEKFPVRCNRGTKMFRMYIINPTRYLSSFSNWRTG